MIAPITRRLARPIYQRRPFMNLPASWNRRQRIKFYIYKFVTTMPMLFGLACIWLVIDDIPESQRLAMEAGEYVVPLRHGKHLLHEDDPRQELANRTTSSVSGPLK